MLNTIYLLSEKVNNTIDSLKELAKEIFREKYPKLYCGYIMPDILFATLDGDERLGFYDNNQNLIVLKDTFLEDGAEEMRNNVFLHELAHFVEYRIYGVIAHDKEFREICSELGVDPDYSYAYVKKYFDKKEKINDKISKLLALSSSDFDGEAQSAIDKAMELMEKYNIVYNSEDTKNELYGVDVFFAKRLDVWRRLLLSVISNITGAWCLTNHTYNGKTLQFFGSKEQCEAALYLWEYFIYNIEEQFKSIKSKITGQIRPAEIHEGIVAGIQEKIRSKSNAIAISLKKNEYAYCAIKKAKISHTTIRSNNGNQYYEGMKAGSNIDIPNTEKGFTKRIASK